MLDPAEEHAVATQFGVARTQVRRDHLISHLLAAISDSHADDVLFIGGTALSRSFAPDGRLSEDIDLIARDDRRSTAAALEQTLIHATRREYPGLRWQPPLTAVRDTAPATLTASDGTTVRIQLLSPLGYPPWPLRQHSLQQRYTDAPPATLTVPTLASFAAWKTSTWADRAAARDLFDLHLLAARGAMTTEAADLFRRYGPTNAPPSATIFTRAPDEQTWRRQLAGQTRLHITALEALTTVRDAWTRLDKPR